MYEQIFLSFPTTFITIFEALLMSFSHLVDPIYESTTGEQGYILVTLRAFFTTELEEALQEFNQLVQSSEEQPMSQQQFEQFPTSYRIYLPINENLVDFYQSLHTLIESNNSISNEYYDQIVSSDLIAVQLYTNYRGVQYLHDLEDEYNLFSDCHTLSCTQEEEDEEYTSFSELSLTDEVENCTHPEMRQLFNEVAEEYNLLPLINKAREMGIAVIISNFPTADGNGHSYFYRLNLIRLRLDAHRDYQSALAHELGHVVAYQKGLDHSNEVLAWDLAQELYTEVYNQQPPTNFYQTRREALATYGIYQEPKAIKPKQNKLLTKTISAIAAASVLVAGAFCLGPTLMAHQPEVDEVEFTY